jgi:hypothetical protein
MKKGNFLLIFFVLFAVPFAAAQETAEIRSFRWEAVPFADRYEVVLEKAGDKGNFEAYGDMEIAATELSLPFLPGSYRYRVFALDSYGGKSEPSPWTSFEIAAPPEKEPERVFVTEGPQNFRITASYAPLLPVYGAVNKIVDAPWRPLGADLRFAYLPFAVWRFSLGFYTQVSYADLSRNTERLFSGELFFAGGGAGAELPLIGENFLLQLRLGGAAGFYHNLKFLNSSYKPIELNIDVAAIGGISLMYRFSRLFSIEAGAEFIHLFTADSPQEGFVRPLAGLGVRF